MVILLLGDFPGNDNWDTVEETVFERGLVTFNVIENPLLVVPTSCDSGVVVGWVFGFVVIISVAGSVVAVFGNKIVKDN